MGTRGYHADSSDPMNAQIEGRAIRPRPMTGAAAIGVKSRQTTAKRIAGPYGYGSTLKPNGMMLGYCTNRVSSKDHTTATLQTTNKHDYSRLMIGQHSKKILMSGSDLRNRSSAHFSTGPRVYGSNQHHSRQSQKAIIGNSLQDINSKLLVQRNARAKSSTYNTGRLAATRNNN